MNELEKYKACCAEMRYIIQCFAESHDASAEQMIKNALSTDCGKGWVSPQDHERLLELVRSETEKRSMEACVISKEIAEQQGWLSPEKAKEFMDAECKEQARLIRERDACKEQVKVLRKALEDAKDTLIKLNNGCYPLEYCSEETRYRWNTMKSIEQAIDATN